jgi:hypothetical protein
MMKMTLGRSAAEAVLAVNMSAIRAQSFIAGTLSAGPARRNSSA